jgi:NADPH2:quinone reductase
MPPASTVRTCSSARANTRCRRAPPTCRAWKWPARSSDGDPGELAAAAFKKGDLVCALVQGGGYAEYCAAPLAQCLPVPQGLSARGRGAARDFLHGLEQRVPARRPAAGRNPAGAGRQLGHRRDRDPDRRRRSATACSRPPAATTNAAPAKSWAPSARSITSTEDFDRRGQGPPPKEGRRRGARHGRRRLPAARNQACLADDGRIVIIACWAAPRRRLDLGQVLRRRLTVTGSTLRPRPVEFKAFKSRAKLQERVWPLLASRQASSR